MLTIVMNTRSDYFLAKDNILSIINLYKTEEYKPEIVLISDGVNIPTLKDFCEFNNVRYLKGERLYLSSQGGAWVKRWLDQGVIGDSQWVLRIDPDTRIFKSISLEYDEDIDVVSPYFPKDCNPNRLHGSFQLIRRDAAIKILESGILDSDKYKMSEYTYGHNLSDSIRLKYKDNKDRSVGINEDLIFSEVCHKLKFKTYNASIFMNCWWRKKPNDSLLANPVAEHPYLKIDNIKNRVFGIGLSRTGTSSLNQALNMLGVDSVHYSNNIKSFDDVQLCLDMYEGFTDVPIPSMYKELDSIYQNSKFILTIRDMKKWMDSVKHYIKLWNDMMEKTEPILSPEQAEERKIIRGFLAENYEKFYGYNLAKCIDDEKIDYILSSAYSNHYLDVVNYFKDKKDQLLILDVSEENSFIKLADFMNSSAPQNNMPFKNSINEAISRIKDREKAIIRNYNKRMNIN